MKKMGDKKIIIFVLIVVLCVFLLGGTFVLSRKQVSNTVVSDKPIQTANIQENSNWKSYSNEKYGYSIKVPKELFVNTYDSDNWTISSADISENTTTINLRVYPDIELTISEADTKQPRYEYKNSFESFISLPSQIGCNADSEDVSSQCDKILQLNSYITATGLKGSVYYINQILTYHQKNGEVNNKWGPIYAFDISKNTNYDQRALIIGPAFTSGPSNVDENLLKGIVDSLSFKRGS